jgi:WD40 repeat protein
VAEIFISYSRRDKDFVQRLASALNALDREIWLDERDIELTAEWLKEIFANIEAADNFLFVISPDSVASPYARKEIDHAATSNKRMVPIYYRSVADADIPEPVAKFQRIDFATSADFNQTLAKLIQALDTDLDWKQTHTRLLIRAKEWEREGKDVSFLLRGKDLSEAEQWLVGGAEKEPKPTALHGQYIVASRRSATRVQRIIIGAVAGALVVAIGLAIYAFLQRSAAQAETKEAQTQRKRAEENATEAKRNATEAERQTQVAVLARERAEAEASAAAANLLANRARQVARQDPQLGLLLTAEAADRLLQKKLPVTTAVTQTLVDLFGQANGIGLRGHRTHPISQVSNEDLETNITAIAISPDSKWIAAGDHDGRLTLRLSVRPDAWVELLPGVPTRGGDHQQAIYGLEFNADSTRLAAAKFDEVRVWNISNRPKEIARCTGHKQFVYDVLFVPGKPGLLVSASGSGVRLWNIQASPPTSVRISESELDYRAVLAMNGELVVSKDAKVWHVSDPGEPEILPGFSGDGVSMAVSGKGDKVAIGTFDGKVHVWWLESREHKSFEQGDFIKGLAFSPDGDALASASWNRTVKVWDLTGKEKPLTFEHPDKVNAVAFDPSGKKIASAGSDRFVRVWSSYWLATPAPVVLGGLAGDGAADHIAFSPDGSFLLSAGYEPLPRLWLLKQVNPGVHLFPSPTFYGFESLVVDRKNRRLGAISRESGPMIWRLDKPDEAPVSLPDASNNSFQIALSDNGVWAASSGVGTNSYLWTIERPDLKPRELVGSGGDRNKVVFSPDSSLIAELGKDDSITIESTAANQVSRPKNLPGGDKTPPYDLAFDPSGTRIADIHIDGSAFLWDLKTSKAERLAGPISKRLPIGIRFSADGSHLALAWWDSIEWKSLAQQSSVSLPAPSGRRITNLSISENSLLLAAGASDGTTLLWELSENVPFRHDLPGQTREVLDVAFSPGGDWLASATADMIRVWSIRDLSATPLRLDIKQVKNISGLNSGSFSSISGIQFISADTLAAASSNGTVVSWDLNARDLLATACQTAGRELTSQEVSDYLDGVPAGACPIGNRFARGTNASR